MIKELRKLDKENHAKTVYIRNLQSRGVIKKIINKKGYLCYDTEELEKRKKTVKWGRPPKIKNDEN